MRDAKKRCDVQVRRRAKLEAAGTEPKISDRPGVIHGLSQHVLMVSAESSEQVVGDDHPVDLVGALIDLGALRVAHQAFQPRLA